MKKTKLSNDLLESLLATFITLVSSYWAIYLIISSLLFIAKAPLTQYNLFASAILTLVFILWFSHKLRPDKFLILVFSSLLLFIITFLPAIFISSKIYDLSFDGQAYHQEAVIQFVRGWNPVYMTLTNEATANLERWLNHYPKATWVLAAGIYDLTKNIEAAKVISLYSLFIGLVGVVWAQWKVKADIASKFLIALALALNPVVIYQSLSFYLDGVLITWLLLMGAILFKIAHDSQHKIPYKYLLWPYFLTFITLINIKFTAFVFAAVLSAGFLSYLWFTERFYVSLQIFKFALLGLLVGGILIGFNPYITNVATHGHPFYPTMGKGALDYVPGNTPENYWSYLPPARFIHSIFSESSNARGEGQSANLKIPFTISTKELETFRVTSPKISGFGPLFGGAFLVSLFLFLHYVLSPVVGRNKKIALIWVFTAIIGTTFVISTSSVSRFVPYVWWLPILIAAFFVFEGGLFTLLAQGIFVILLINSIMIFASYVPYTIAQSQKIDKELSRLSGQVKEPLYVDVAQFGSTKIKLKNYGIPFSEVYKDTECKSRKRLLVENITEVCELPSPTSSP